MQNMSQEAQTFTLDLVRDRLDLLSDHAAWRVLCETVVPQVFANKRASDAVRVWVIGCGTGIAAYAVARLLEAHQKQLDTPPHLQVFATDSDEEAIIKARRGRYPMSIADDIAPEWLERLFRVEGQEYVINKVVRNLVVFAPHNVLHDPPLVRLDLVINCSQLNVLDEAVQGEVLTLFYHILQPGGYLVPGPSGSEVAAPDLFDVIDAETHSLQRRAVAPGVRPLSQLTLHKRSNRSISLSVDAAAPTARDLHWQLLAQYSPLSVLIDPAYNIVHISRREPHLLRLAEGAPSSNLITVIHPTLRSDLQAALVIAAQQGTGIETRCVPVQLGQTSRHISIAVQPVHESEAARGYCLVIFHDRGAAESPAAPPYADDAPQILHGLEAELRRTQERLWQTIREYRDSTDNFYSEHEELLAANEELQATNEELQAAYEELDTSREELQSINEDLQVANAQLELKIKEVITTNDDLQNLMAATEIGTIFLDRRLRITRYTPRVQELFNLIPDDLNRPLTHVTHKLEYATLPEDVTRVWTTWAPIEREVRSMDSRWYLARLRTYRTSEDNVDGVVLTFVDITARKQAEEEREQLLAENQQQREFLEQLVALMPVPIAIVRGHEFRYTLVNSAYRQLGRGKGELLDRTVAEVWPEIASSIVPLLDQVYRTGEPYQASNMPFMIQRDGQAQEEFYMLSYVRLPYTASQPAGVLITAYETTEQVRARQVIEARVQERTWELNQVNAALRVEALQRAQLEQERIELLRALVTAQEEERHHIARELHDQMGQSLSALRLGLSALAAAPAPKDAITRLQRIVAQIDDDVHRLALELRPSALDNLGLLTAVQQHVEEWSTLTGITADVQTIGTDYECIPSEVAIVIYRVTQEALTNVLKHAHARHISVILEARANQVNLIVEDDGRGFDPDASQLKPDAGRIGLLSMRERVALVGGAFTIESEPEHGTSIFVRIPLAPTAQEVRPDA